MKEFSYEFYSNVTLNENNNNGIKYFGSYFEEPSILYVDSTTQEQSSQGDIYPACLSVGHVYIATGGMFRILPAEVPALEYNMTANQLIFDNTMSSSDSNSTSQQSYLASFYTGDDTSPSQAAFQRKLAQRSITLQQQVSNTHFNPFFPPYNSCLRSPSRLVYVHLMCSPASSSDSF